MDIDDLPLHDHRQPRLHQSGLNQLIESASALDTHEVHLLKAALDVLVPSVEANDIDLSKEVATQLAIAKALQALTITENINPNQKAATIRTVNQALRQLADLQASTYNIERSKKLEEALVLTLRGHPDGEALVHNFKVHFKRMINARDRTQKAG